MKNPRKNGVEDLLCKSSPLRSLKTSQRFKGILPWDDRVVIRLRNREECIRIFAASPHRGDCSSRREKQAGEEPAGSSISEEVQQDLEDKKNSSEFFNLRDGVTLINVEGYRQIAR